MLRKNSRLMFEAVTSSMIMVNDRGLITLVNPQTEQLFRYRWKELPEQRIEMLVPERYRSAHPDQGHGFFQDPTTGTKGAGRACRGVTAGRSGSRDGRIRGHR